MDRSMLWKMDIMKMARERPRIISLIERDTLVIMTASEDGEDELSLAPAGYYKKNHICHVTMKKRIDT